MDINFAKIEKKWQRKWEKEKIFEVNEHSKKSKFYVLEMFPYPSGSGLHMGHALNYTIGDIFARFKRMQRFNVLYPMGYDAFGLPAENSAIKAGEHPKKYTENSIKNFILQQKSLGLSYDWSKTINTSDSEYYKWNQYFFLKFFENGLIYRKKSSVNWCPKCKTVLANEQVHHGKCEYHKNADVEIKPLEQWFVKTTNYAEELLADLEKLNWPDKIKTLQKNWIGKSNGTEIDFEIFTNSNFIQLHGFEATPDDDFHPWLKKELESRGYKVQVPSLPNTENPSVEEQVNYVLKNCKFDENTILIGHSLGSVVALKVLEKLKSPIKKLVLTAGFVEPVTMGREYNKSHNWKFNFAKIKKNSPQVIILHDNNDSEIPSSQAEKLKSFLDGELIYFDAKEDHICGKEEPEVLNVILEKWPIFTTRPDTIFGVTFMVVSAQHPKLFELVTKEQKKEVEKFLKKLKSTSEKDASELEKDGVFTGSYTINPLTKEKVPIYAGNFVIADYGSGMVMAVPAHDQRDFEFAKKYGIEVKQVIEGKLTNKNAITGSGKLINSQEFSELNNQEAKEKITEFLIKKKLGRKVINYKLRDWLISRQRYWGTPIPIVYCDKCGIVPVPEKDLPVKLPREVKFGEGNPLATNKEFVDVKCPKCRGKARRETDTMDTFFDSSWYYLRYCDNKNLKSPFDGKRIKYWMPVDQYIGGAEHACMHLIYARFFTKVLRDLKFLNFDEPFIKLFNQGMLHGEDREKMSKSRGNVILPESVSKKYGIDTARLFLISQASPENDTQWGEQGIEGSYKFLNKIVEYFENIKLVKTIDAKTESKLNKTIKEVTNQIENFKYNLAIIKIRELFNSLPEKTSKDILEKSLKLLHPFCPHITEELWEKLGNKLFISLSEWPKVDESKINEMFDKQEQAMEKIISDIHNILKIVESKGEKKDRVYIYILPNEKEIYNESEISKRINKEVKIFAVNNNQKYDPTNISKKSKANRPAVYLE